MHQVFIKCTDGTLKLPADALIQSMMARLSAVLARDLLAFVVFNERGDAIVTSDRYAIEHFTK